MNLLVCKKFNEVGSRDAYKGEFKELVVEGSHELSVLCPVSKLTGFPMSLQEAVMYITDKNVRLADFLLQVLPTIPSDDSISDDDKLSMLVSRLDTGSFFENDKAAEVLGEVARNFFPAADVDKVVDSAKQTINFESGDAPSVDA